MIRTLLRNLGAFKTSLLITIAAVLSSVLLYLVAGIFFIKFSPAGIIMSTLLPAMVAPFLSYFLLKLLIKLDSAELALAKINDELEERVQHRTGHRGDGSTRTGRGGAGVDGVAVLPHPGPGK